ncbi:hypothetical protein CA51_43090 [Rosistilla oblonga]|nr:hypothetical protein CA51_43090 [Rosistilla oblonga]
METWSVVGRYPALQAGLCKLSDLRPASGGLEMCLSPFGFATVGLKAPHATAPSRAVGPSPDGNLKVWLAATQPCRLGYVNCRTYGPRRAFSECACPLLVYLSPFDSACPGSVRVRAEGSTICLAQPSAWVNVARLRPGWAEGPACDGPIPGRWPFTRWKCSGVWLAATQPCGLGYANCWTYGPRRAVSECACPLLVLECGRPLPSPAGWAMQIAGPAARIGRSRNVPVPFWFPPSRAVGPSPDGNLKVWLAATQPCWLGYVNCRTYGPDWAFSDCVCPLSSAS